MIPDDLLNLRMISPDDHKAVRVNVQIRKISEPAIEKLRRCFYPLSRGYVRAVAEHSG